MTVSGNAKSEDLDVIEAKPTPESLVSVAQAARRRHRTIITILRILVLVVMLGSWEITTRIEIPDNSIHKSHYLVDPFSYGQPSGIVLRIRDWIVNGTEPGPLWEQVAVTLEEAVLGFFIGVILGIVCGVTLGRIPLLAEVLGPYIKMANSIPRIILGSIFIISLGFGLPSKVALAVVLVFFVVFFNAFQGVREVDRNLIANARILGATPWQLNRQVILPSALTWIIASLHTSFGFALVGAIVGEFLGARQGMGLVIATAKGTFDANGIFAGMVILAVIALICEGLITMLENRLLKWRPPTISDVMP